MEGNEVVWLSGTEASVVVVVMVPLAGAVEVD